MKKCIWKDEILDHAYTLFEDVEETTKSMISTACFFVYRYEFDIERLQSPLYENVKYAMKYTSFSDIPADEGVEISQLLYHCSVLFKNVTNNDHWTIEACFFFVLLFDFDIRLLPSFVQEPVRDLLKKHLCESCAEEYAC